MTNEFDASQIEKKFKEHLQYVDDTALIVLKGHLLVEEVLDSIISKFVFHTEFLNTASLRFPQKVNLVRAFSLDEHENDMWDLAIAINTLRNELAHTLRTDKRERKIQALKGIYFKEASNLPEKLRSPDLPDQIILYWSIAMLLGFLDACKKEAERFRAWVDDLDRVVNRHRHKKDKKR